MSVQRRKLDSPTFACDELNCESSNYCGIDLIKPMYVFYTDKSVSDYAQALSRRGFLYYILQMGTVIACMSFLKIVS